MRQDYQREIDKLKDIVIDIAFVPLDPDRKISMRGEWIIL